MEISTTTLVGWALFIVLLGILGINLFSYLQRTTDLAAGLGLATAGTAVDVGKTAVKGTATGLEVGLEETEKIVGGALGEVEHALDYIATGNSNTLSPKPDSSDSIVQNRNTPGYCYIGKDRGVRSCLFVGVNDSCMSGDIYPSMDICVNPKLRV